MWIGLAGWVVAFSILTLRFRPWLHISDRIDTWWLLRIAQFRVGWVTHIMRAIKVAGYNWPIIASTLTSVRTSG